MLHASQFRAWSFPFAAHPPGEMLRFPMPVTLQQHVQQRHGPELASVVQSIAQASILIEQRLRTAALSGVLGAQGSTNVQGEQQQKLDVLANDLLTDAMRQHPAVAAAVSEEDDDAVLFSGKPDATFVAIYDPLDGSSNLDVNVNVGTIVSIQRMAPGSDPSAAALQAGSSQAAALYVNYGPATMLVYTAGSGTHAFTLSNGEYLLSTESLAIPSQGPYYSVNEGNAAEFPAGIRGYLDSLRSGDLLGTKYGARYIGSFIADLHRTLLKGGVFLYPPTSKAPTGKLRLLYEANPLAMLVEQAGGKAVTIATPGAPSERILNILPHALHQRTTIATGGPAEIDALVAHAATQPGA